MASDSLQPSATVAPSSPAGPSSRVKFRVRFRKTGDLRFVSHHDLMHIFERTFRRAHLTIPTTQGFNPRPKMWFALSLALGIAGLNEVMELELSEPLTAEEVQRRLTTHVPPGIDILSVRTIDVKTAARVRRAWYRLPVETSDLRQRCADFLSRPDCWIKRTRPHQRRVNLRPFVSELHARDSGVEMALWITPRGAARPEEILAALGLAPLLADGAVLERTDLEIFDELPPGTLTASVPDLENAIEETRTDDRESPDEAATSVRPTAIVGDPLSFDS